METSHHDALGVWRAHRGNDVRLARDGRDFYIRIASAKLAAAPGECFTAKNSAKFLRK